MVEIADSLVDRLFKDLRKELSKKTYSDTDILSKIDMPMKLKGASKVKKGLKLHSLDELGYDELLDAFTFEDGFVALLNELKFINKHDILIELEGKNKWLVSWIDSGVEEKRFSTFKKALEFSQGKYLELTAPKKKKK